MYSFDTIGQNMSEDRERIVRWWWLTGLHIYIYMADGGVSSVHCWLLVGTLRSYHTRPKLYHAFTGVIVHKP